MDLSLNPVNQLFHRNKSKKPRFCPYCCKNFDLKEKFDEHFEGCRRNHSKAKSLDGLKKPRIFSTRQAVTEKPATMPMPKPKPTASFSSDSTEKKSGAKASSGFDGSKIINSKIKTTINGPKKMSVRAGTKAKTIASANDPLACHICSKKLASVSSLNKHLRHHKDDKTRYICNTCGKPFDQIWNLLRHEFTHTGEKPAVCKGTGCGKEYSTEWNLKRHIAAHQKKSPFHCRFCDKTFITKGHFDRHLKGHKNTEAAA